MNIKEYLIENNLVQRKEDCDNDKCPSYELKSADYIPPTAKKINEHSLWGDQETFPLDYDEAVIVLCSSIKIIDANTKDLAYVKFGIQEHNDAWNIYAWWINDWRKLQPYDEGYPRFFLETMFDTIMMLIPYMAGSNVSYLRDSMMYDLY